MPKPARSTRHRKRLRTQAAQPPPAGHLPVFEHPLATRYATPAMLRIWSAHNRYGVWRRIWIALAEAQRELGLPISAAQIAALRSAADDIDFGAAAEHERRTRHDVMAHIHAFADAAPQARGILHLGATSMDIVDNADLMLMRDALELLVGRLAAVAAALEDFCAAHADRPCLGFTHLQPAQLTTVGKRAALWLADVADDLERVAELWAGLKCRGLRGATGTQDSFLKLLGGPAKVRRLERRFAARLGFRDCYPVCGQTYSRRVDAEIISALAGLAASLHKACNDVRLLSMLREMDEPFEAEQVGSSAMPYKRNPALCERATGLARYLVSLASSPLMTHAAQMLERTLDDSSNKRLVIPEAFLAADALCAIMHTVFSGLVVYPAVIDARVRAELPFIATEQVLMQAVAAGGDRQELHERLRRHSQAAAEQIKRHGRPNDLLERLRGDPAFARVRWDRALDPRRYTGLAAEQTRRLLSARVRPLLRRFAGRAAPPERPRV
ncbi:MAG: adenylosuccinate lyase [Phycisphaerae bacterium]|nr:adenylosuccinate lyase [Phycisphaerae bacterium]MCZ2401143.1 adenylosuccinate lyase [Phycisphaerae bacterium]